VLNTKFRIEMPRALRVALLIFALTNIIVWLYVRSKAEEFGFSTADSLHTFPVHLRGVGTYYFSTSLGWYLAFAPPGILILLAALFAPARKPPFDQTSGPV
jgi:hypothetical protein